MEDKFEDLIKKPLVLLGAGGLAHLAISIWPNDDLSRPVFIIDRSPRASSLYGIPIFKNSEHRFNKRYGYVLAFFEEDAKNIHELFSEIDQPIFTVYDIFEQYISDQFSNGWSYPIGIETQKRFVSCFEDRSSVMIAEAVMAWRTNRKLVLDYPRFKKIEKYFLHGGELPSGNFFSLVIDGGANDCCLMQSLATQNIRCAKYIAVEPDEKNFVGIDEHLVSKVTDQFELITQPLDSAEREVNFLEVGSLSSRIIDNNRTMMGAVNMTSTSLRIICEKLVDNEEEYNKSVLCKLHIEGTEWSVIRADLGVLMSFDHVVIVVNLSHNMASTLHIPALLKANGFKMRLHSYSLFGEGLNCIASKVNNLNKFRDRKGFVKYGV
jgi:hypothetical protein